MEDIALVYAALIVVGSSSSGSTSDTLHILVVGRLCKHITLLYVHMQGESIDFIYIYDKRKSNLAAASS